MAGGSSSTAMRMFRALCCLLFLLMAAGCATSSKIDWDNRLGTYTYDEAVLEFGPPDKSASIADGVVVADWVVMRGRLHTYAGPDMMYTRRGPYGVPMYGGYMPMEAVRTPDRILRLTFNSQKKLTAYKYITR